MSYNFSNLYRQLIDLVSKDRSPLEEPCDRAAGQAEFDVREAEKSSVAVGTDKAVSASETDQGIQASLDRIINTADHLKSCGLKPHEQAYVETISQSSQTLRLLIETGSVSAPDTTENKEAEKNAFDLYSIINATIKSLQPEADKHGIKLKNSIGLDIPFRFLGNPLNLANRIAHLLNDAINQVKEGPINLTCQLQDTDSSKISILFEVTNSGTTPSYIAKASIDLTPNPVIVSDTEMLWMQKCRVLRLCHDPKEITETLHSLQGWGVNHLNITDSSRCLEEISKAIENDTVFNAIIFDNRFDAELLTRIAALFESDQLLSNTKILVIGSRENVIGIEELTKRQQLIQSIYEPINKSLLFNGLHASYGANQNVHHMDMAVDQQSLSDSVVKPLKILVAEDNAINGMVTDRILEIAGHLCHQVEDGVELLEALEEDEFDLVILDMKMPKLSGLDAFKAYRFTHPDSQLPFIMLTADSTDETRHDAKQAGIEFFLTKPVSQQALIDTLMKATDQQGESFGTQTVKAGRATFNSNLIDKQSVVDLMNLAPNKAFIEKILNKLDHDGSALIQAMEIDLFNRDFEEMRSHAHALKGSASSLGLTQLTGIIATIESLNDSELLESGNTVLSELKTAFIASQEALSTIAQQLADDSPAPREAG